MKETFRNFYYSFPTQLIILHLRNNHALLILWLVSTGFLLGWFGKGYGMKYLFLDPEYFGRVDFWSFLIVGQAFGGFWMTWNLTIYILKSYRFPFLASLDRPFLKFTINNSIIPITFLIFYLVSIIRFQWYNEFAEEYSIVFYCIGFILGVSISIIITAIYFNLTNKDIFNFQKIKKYKGPNPPGSRKKETDLELTARIQRDAWRVDYYYNNRLQSKIVRDVRHYDPEILVKVFRQNHSNALMFQIISLLVLVLLGLMVENKFFRIPAGASIFVFLAVLTSLLGLLSYWVRGWRTTGFILLFIGLNYLTSLPWIKYENKAYGLDYTKERLDYSYDNLKAICTDSIYLEDKANTQAILSKWQSQFGTGRLLRKPSLVIINISGGGLRAGVWGTHVVQQVDSLLSGRLMDHTVLMTGASGGMFGAAFVRDLFIEKQQNDSINWHNKIYFDQISKDLLNPIVFTILTNDFFMPWRKFEQDQQWYHLDRGYIIEKQLMENTNGLLNKKIMDYQALEQEAKIPMLMVTPTIINDSRRLIISAQPASYLMRHPVSLEKPNLTEIDAVDFNRLFVDHGGENLTMRSALRMNATYPYILPQVQFPTKPAIRVIDAGWTDNYGIETAGRFLNTFEDWVNKYVGNVVLIQIRGSEKVAPIDKDYKPGFMDKYFSPVGIAAQIPDMQDYNQDDQLNYLSKTFGKDRFHLVRFIYKPSKENERASMSFHLTEREKQDIYNAFYLEHNQKSLSRLKDLVR